MNYMYSAIIESNAYLWYSAEMDSSVDWKQMVKKEWKLER